MTRHCFYYCAPIEKFPTSWPSPKPKPKPKPESKPEPKPKPEPEPKPKPKDKVQLPVHYLIRRLDRQGPTALRILPSNARKVLLYSAIVNSSSPATPI